MITRREVALGGMLIILNGPVCKPCRAETRTSGCIISGELAHSYLGQVSTPAALETIARSGNNDFDFAVAQTLSKLTDLFDVLPGFAYYKQVGNSRNAKATAARLLSNLDGTVLFGRDLFLEIMNYPESPDAAVAAICAHEFGHIVQFKNHITLDAGQATVKRSELHADFLAGYFSGRRKLDKPNFPAAVFATTFEHLGDYEFNDFQHHGTPEQRVAAIVRGFEVAYRERQTGSDAIQASINYASRL